MGRAGKRTRLVAVLTGVLLAGCGNGGGATPPGTAKEKTIPKSAFIHRADELCARAYTKAKGLKTPPLPPREIRELDEVAAFFRAQVAIGSRELARIRRLGTAVPGTAAQAENLDTADDLVAEMHATAYHAREVHLVRTRAHYGRVQAISERATEL